MISRVADHCFWLGRHVERAEGSARLLAATRSLALDAALTPRPCWPQVVVVAGEEEPYRRRFGPGADDGERVQRYLTWDEETPSSIRRTLRAARENARAVRDVVSQEVWEVLNELHLWLGSAAAAGEWREDRHGFYRRVVRGCQLTLAVVDETMLHEDAHQFIRLGTALERAGQTARLLDVHHDAFASRAPSQVIEAAAFLALLHACSGFEPFMKRRRGAVTAEAIAAFLVGDPSFPRSIRFALAEARARLALLAPASPGGPGAEALALLQAFEAELRDGAVATSAPGLHALLTRVVDRTAAVCDSIGEELLGQARTGRARAAVQLQ